MLTCTGNDCYEKDNFWFGYLLCYVDCRTLIGFSYLFLNNPPINEYRYKYRKEQNFARFNYKDKNMLVFNV